LECYVKTKSIKRRSQVAIVWHFWIEAGISVLTTVLLHSKNVSCRYIHSEALGTHAAQYRLRKRITQLNISQFQIRTILHIIARHTELGILIGISYSGDV